MTDPYVPLPHIDLPPHVDLPPFDPSLAGQPDPSLQQPMAQDHFPPADHAQVDPFHIDQFDQGHFDQIQYDQVQYDQTQYGPGPFNPPDAYYVPQPPGDYQPPDPPGAYVAPDPPGFAPDPPDYVAPDPPEMGDYWAPDPPGFADTRASDLRGFVDYLAPDPPGFADYVAEPPGFGDRPIQDPRQPDDYLAAASPAPNDGPVLDFAIPADLVDDIGQAQNPQSTNAAETDHPGRDSTTNASPSSGDAFDKMKAGEVTWLDDSADSGDFAGMQEPPTKPTLVPDPDSPNSWLLQIEDPNPPDRHLYDHGRDLGADGMGKVTERETITLARIETPDGSPPAVGVMRGVDDRMAIVVNLPPGGCLAETTAPLNNVINIYGFANFPGDATAAGATPGADGPPPPTPPPAASPPPAAPPPGATPPPPQQPWPQEEPEPAPDPAPAAATPGPAPGLVPPGPQPFVPPGFESPAPPTHPPAGAPPQPGPPPDRGHASDDPHPDRRLWLDQGGSKQPAGRPHPAKAKEPEGGEQRRWSGTGRPDPDGVNRTPGRTSRVVIHTPEGIRVLRNAEYSLDTDPAFRDVARKVRDRMRTDSYDSFRKHLNREIKTILRGGPDHALKKIVEVRSDGSLVWKAGTAFAGQELHYAHTVSQQSTKNIGGHRALNVALRNLDPVGADFHLKEYGHVWERLTNHLKGTPIGGAATAAGTNEWAISKVPPGRPGQAGFVTIANLVFLSVLTATGVVIVKSSESRSEAIAQLSEVGVGLAVQEIIVGNLDAGIAGVGFAVGVAMGMRSDDKETSERRAIEEARHEAVDKFIDTYLPETVRFTPNAVIPQGLAHAVGISPNNRHYDITVQNQVYDLLFAVPPTRPQPLY